MDQVIEDGDLLISPHHGRVGFKMSIVIEGVDVNRLKPMPKHIVVEWDGRPETKGGVIIPETRHRASYMLGWVLAAGLDCDESLTVGTRIMFDGLCDKEFIGPECPGDRPPVFFMRAEYVLGVVEGS